MDSLKHHFAETNGIRMHYVEQGAGPLVLLCHGFPESWYSWRHQIPALAAAGFRVVAPDQRGYGQTDQPMAIEAYDALQLTGDLVMLVRALGEESAVLVGHDWGSMIAGYCALLRPDVFPAVAFMSVPFLPRSRTAPSEEARLISGDRMFYQTLFQEPGRAERDLEANVRRSLLMLLYSVSGDPPPHERWNHLFDKSKTFVDSLFEPESLPAWITEKDLDFMTAEFERTGFRGGLNWYRNIERNWQLTPFLDGARPLQPTMFLAGDLDVGLRIYPQAFEQIEAALPNLKSKVMLKGGGHWIQQERPGEVNDALLHFLKIMK
jgi:pimeloyl-ACP methyl ester carboxylesterase